MTEPLSVYQVARLLVKPEEGQELVEVLDTYVIVGSIVRIKINNTKDITQQEENPYTLHREVRFSALIKIWYDVECECVSVKETSCYDLTPKINEIIAATLMED